MGVSETVFKPLPEPDAGSELTTLLARPRAFDAGEPWPGPAAATTARFHGFDQDDAPLLAGLRHFPGEVVRARTTVALQSGHIGCTVLVMCEDGDWTLPIVIGVMQEHRKDDVVLPVGSGALSVQVHADGDRLVLNAEREVVLQCGAASITLTRAGKVLIQGSYVMTRSTGYNKIKGAAIDIN